MKATIKITVLALLLTSVLVAVSSADVTGTVKGGGFISSVTPGYKATFGINTTNMTLTYVDHNMMIVHATVEHVHVSGNTATITGTATVKTPPGPAVATTFTVEVEDNGTPGRGQDKFKITLGTGYSNGLKTLGGGNIVVS